ncbi:MAG: hypothetical protein ABIP79_05675 [Chitinophagaceae bacterium]
MKPILVSILLLLFAISSTIAQNSPSPEAEAFFKKAMSAINPRHVAWIKATAKKVHEKNMTDADVKIEATNWAVLGNISNGDIEAMCFLVLMQASKSAQEDLKTIMAKVKSINQQKQQQREMLSKMQKQHSINSIQLDSFKLLRSKTIALQKHQNPDTVKFIRSAIVNKQPSKSDIAAMIEQTKNDLDSMSEMSEMESLRLQMAMDKMSKMMSTLSNLLKKISVTANQIIQNLK